MEERSSRRAPSLALGFCSQRQCLKESLAFSEASATECPPYGKCQPAVRAGGWGSGACARRARDTLGGDGAATHQVRRCIIFVSVVRCEDIVTCAPTVCCLELWCPRLPVTGLYE